MTIDWEGSSDYHPKARRTNDRARQAREGSAYSLGIIIAAPGAALGFAGMTTAGSIIIAIAVALLWIGIGHTLARAVRARAARDRIANDEIDALIASARDDLVKARKWEAATHPTTRTRTEDEVAGMARWFADLSLADQRAIRNQWTDRQAITRAHRRADAWTAYTDHLTGQAGANMPADVWVREEARLRAALPVTPEVRRDRAR